MTITNADGSQSARVRVTPTGVPGFVIHPAQDTVGWTLTHVPTGASAGWWLAARGIAGSVSELPGQSGRPWLG